MQARNQGEEILQSQEHSQASAPIINIESRIKPADRATDHEPAVDNMPVQSARRKNIKGYVSTGIATLLLLSGGIAGTSWYRYLSAHEETDDAYITGHLHQVSSRIDGTVDKVWIDDNQHVRQGQTLVTLDPNDYQVKADQALANLEQAQREAKTAQTSVNYQATDAHGQDMNAQGSVANALANISKSEATVREVEANILASQAYLNAKQAELDRADIDYRRYDSLAKEGAVKLIERDAAKRDYLVALENRNSAREALEQTTQRLQEAKDSVNASKAQLTQAQAQIQLAKASAVQVQVNQAKLDTDLAAIRKAQAALDEARLNLSYTKIVAPISGRIGKKTVEEGHRIQPGEPLLTIVSDDPWVVANYKETQLKRIRAGQKVEIRIDALPDHKFEGRVLSFSPASGASFAILPSDNATGNFTKIVQRLPVKILFTAESVKGYEDRLAPGLSVITSVDVSSRPEPASVLAEAKQ